MYYLADDCRFFVNKYRTRIGNALSSIERNASDMDFENAWEKEEICDHLFQIKKALIELDDSLASFSFE